MAAIRTELVKRRHAYTGEDVPWNVETGQGPALWRCLRGGQLAPGTSAWAAVARRQRRFLRFAALLAVLWLVLCFA